MDRSQGILARDKKVVSPSLTRELRIVYKKASGCRIWDADQKKYLDFTACVAVTSAGHNNPFVKRAIIKQLKDGVHCCFSDFYAEVPVAFCEKLLRTLPKGYGKVFLSNSGTEATEAAYKLARWHTNRTYVIAFEGAFHGRTMGSLSMTNSKPVQRDRYAPFLPVVHTPFPNARKLGMEKEECSQHCLSVLEDRMRAIRDDLAGVFMEPIQGEGGYIVPPESFARGVRKLCDEYGALLAMDEVQAGCWRTGKFLAEENFGIKADIVWLSKALANGMPIGATVSSDEIMDWPPGSHANTFGGNLVSCAAGIATLDYMEKNRLGANAVLVGDHIKKRLKKMDSDKIKDIRGIGLMIGVEMNDKKARNELIHNASKKGLLMLPAGESVFRICPPLTLTKKEADEGLDIIEDCLGSDVK